MIAIETVLQVNPDVRFRVHEDEGIVVRQDAGEVIALNEVGARLLDLIDGQRSVAEIIDQLADVFAIDSETLRGDVLRFIEELADVGVVAVP